MNTPRVSIVIPVYNELDKIGDCLAAIAAGTVQPYEVIVVDNNSTDGTDVVAARFPFVKVLYEKQQGVAYARDRGFNAARGDIIARIDADTLITPTWIAQLIDLFTADPELAAVSGSVAYRDVALASLASKIDLLWRREMARELGRDVAMQGANMALRRSAWQAVAGELCYEKGLHEDFDLAVHLNRAGFKLQYVENLWVSVCYRQAKYNMRDFFAYAMASPRTYLYHGVTTGRKMYKVIAFVMLLWPVIILIGRGYDIELGRFSWRKLLLPDAPRPNPATFVD